MRRCFARGPLAACAALAGIALLCGSTGLSAQPGPITVPAGRPLPALVPLPPLPPLPKEGMTASIAAPQSIAPAASAPASTPAAPAPAPSTSPPATTLARVDPAAAGSLNGAQRAAVERVNGYFNSVTTLIGNFVQVGPDRQRLEGDFYLQKPGKVRFDYDPPSPVELIADGSSVVVRDRKLATQDLYPLSQTPLRFLLAEKLDLLKDTNVVGVYQDELFINVVIEEKHPLVGTHRLMLMFGAKDSELKQWTITDPQGYDTTIAIFNLNQTQKPDPALFKIDYTRQLQ